jgi:hypothetical protein
VPELPLRGWVLLGALVVFSIAILSVLYWAQFTGRAGSQRGLVIHNDLSQDLVVEVVGVRRLDIRAGEEETFVLKREQFPTEIIWSQAGSGVHDAQSFEYVDVTDAEFRLSIDEQGIHPTTSYRDTPVPATPEINIYIQNDLDRTYIWSAIAEQGTLVEPSARATLTIRRQDFPIYVLAYSDPELTCERLGGGICYSFGRYARGKEFAFDELAVENFVVVVDAEGLHAGVASPMTTSEKR